MSQREKPLELMMKGLANHRRIEIARLVRREPGLSLLEIAERLRINQKTASEHLRRLALGGHIQKQYEGRVISVRLSAQGKFFLEILDQFSEER